MRAADNRTESIFLRALVGIWNAVLFQAPAYFLGAPITKFAQGAKAGLQGKVSVVDVQAQNMKGLVAPTYRDFYTGHQL